MAFNLTIPKEYGYVLLVATASAIVATWHGSYTGSYRVAAKIPYPNSYASSQEAKENRAKYAFNCAQRAHANFQEHQPQFLVSLLIAGLRYPVASAAMGLVWCAGRVVYTLGYVKSDKESGRGRYAGIWYLVAEQGLLGMAGWTAWKMVSS